MSIYHCNISNVSRAAGSNSCATLSYISGKKIFDERLEKTFSYGRKERVLFFNTLLPDYAPQECKNAEVLFNSIEKFEKADNARTAKKIEVALPREFDLELQIKVLEEYINKNLVADGYAASYAIHSDKENNNPHAHILIPNRQINKNGEWGSKRKMEYALDEEGERIPRLDENGKQKTDKNGRKQWVRINVEQNPLDKKEKLEQLRKAWADECNNFLGEDEKIDHRSYAAQGKDIEPTIHIGYAAAEMEKRGEFSDRVAHNKLVRMLNLLRERINTISESIKSLTSEILDSEKHSNKLYIDSKYLLPEVANPSSFAVNLPKNLNIGEVDISEGFFFVRKKLMSFDNASNLVEINFNIEELNLYFDNKSPIKVDIKSLDKALEDYRIRENMQKQKQMQKNLNRYNKYNDEEFEL